MKLSLLLGLGIALIAISQPVRAGGFEPKIVVQAPENVFVPMGFDDNDNSQIILFANMPDTCHKAGPVRYRIDEAKRTIFIRNEILYYSGCWCADVQVPYTQTVNVGLLNSGEYKVAVETSTGTFKKMADIPIAAATTAAPDDSLYAPVEQVIFAKGKESVGNGEVILTGTFRSSCMQLKDVRLNYRQNHVIEVLPIVEMAASGGCTEELRPFTARIKIKDSVGGRALLHVRSLSGQAINQVIEL